VIYKISKIKVGEIWPKGVFERFERGDFVKRNQKYFAIIHFV
jgi:hypothetical protein